MLPYFTQSVHFCVAHKQTNKQTNKQTHKLTDGQTERLLYPLCASARGKNTTPLSDCSVGWLVLAYKNLSRFLHY